MNINSDYIFETSWEICNKIGGIYTVISTKAKTIVDKYNDNYILIGPDVWKETTNNPDFIEDVTLFTDWKAKAWEDGLKVRTGRWNIEGNPIVILVDFTPLFPKKDEIFGHFWETYKLDSLNGEWDYIESAMFGYAAGQVVESFSNFNLQINNNVVAHFHEWMTGTGILYLKDKAPQISTAFTTHATVLGRSIAGNGYPLYENITQYQPDRIARDFNVTSKANTPSKCYRQHRLMFLQQLVELLPKSANSFLVSNLMLLLQMALKKILFRKEKYLTKNELRHEKKP